MNQAVLLSRLLLNTWAFHVTCVICLARKSAEPIFQLSFVTSVAPTASASLAKRYAMELLLQVYFRNGHILGLQLSFHKSSQLVPQTFDDFNWFLQFNTLSPECRSFQYVLLFTTPNEFGALLANKAKSPFVIFLLLDFLHDLHQQKQLNLPNIQAAPVSSLEILPVHLDINLPKSHGKTASQTAQSHALCWEHAQDGIPVESIRQKGEKVNRKARTLLLLVILSVKSPLPRANQLTLQTNGPQSVHYVLVNCVVSPLWH